MANDPSVVWSRYTPDPNTGCWLWNGTNNGNDYGRLSIRGRPHMAHRVAYELAIGPIPEGLTLDHLCRRRSCINPAHLEPVTNAENVLRGEGVTAKNARLTHCGRGHPLAGDNLRVDRRGYRLCRACHRVHCEDLRRRRGIEKKRIYALDDLRAENTSLRSALAHAVYRNHEHSQDCAGCKEITQALEGGGG